MDGWSNEWTDEEISARIQKQMDTCNIERWTIIGAMYGHIYLLNIIITIQNSCIPDPIQATNKVG